MRTKQTEVIVAMVIRIGQCILTRMLIISGSGLLRLQDAQHLLSVQLVVCGSW